MEIEGNPDPRSGNFLNLRISTLCMGLLIIVTYLLFALDTVEAQEKTIFLNVNGLVTNYSTSHQTIKDLIDEIYPNEKEVISIFPKLNKRIITGDTIFIQIQPSQINKTVAINLKTAVKKASEPELSSDKTDAVPEPKLELSPEPKSPTYVGSATWYRYGNRLTAASTQFPKGTKIRVMAVNSDKMIDVVVNDYGPEDWTGVSLDLNSIAFAKLAPLGAGKIQIKYYVI